jgi:hypothetical protein
MSRHFYRCRGCLEVLALDGDRLPMAYGTTIAVCDNCGEAFEHMGRVEKSRLVSDELRCKCDDRCVSARGPHCDCSCCGANHGAGMLGYVRVMVDRGAVPRIAPPSKMRAIAALREWTDIKARRALLKAELDRLLDRKAGREFLPRADFDRLRALQQANRDLWQARTHAGRLKALRAAGVPEVISQPAPNPIETVAAVVSTAIATARAEAAAEMPYSLTREASTRRATQTSLF